MAWQRLAVVVAGDAAEALGDALEAAGALSVEIADAEEGTDAEEARFAEPGAEVAPWSRARVSALFAEGADGARALDAALAAAAVETLAAASVERVEDADWVARTQRQFAPMRVGERLWIVPTWHEVPDPSAVNILLDPGAAFGTGSHPTTRLCLEWLERNVAPGASVLDYGCGSGILGIAALKLGARAATGIDVDPLALEAARYNSRRNGVDLLVVSAEDPVTAGRASITVANILANPLRVLAPVIAGRTAPGGRIALSGILEEQARDVADAYREWAELDVAGRDSGWVLLGGTRRPC